MLELIGSSINLLAGILLIILGAKDRDAGRRRTKSGRAMIVLGIVVVLSGILWGWQGFGEGYWLRWFFMGRFFAPITGLVLLSKTREDRKMEVSRLTTVATVAGIYVISA